MAGSGDCARLPPCRARSRRGRADGRLKDLSGPRRLPKPPAWGLSSLAKNRVQEFAAKAEALKSQRVGGAVAADELTRSGPVRVHLIGHLQSNKAARAVELFDGIDSVDSVRLAERLNEAAGQVGQAASDLNRGQAQLRGRPKPACFRSRTSWATAGAASGSRSSASAGG